MNISRDTKAMLKAILERYMERETFKAIVKAKIIEEYEISPMRTRMRKRQVHEYLSNKLRYPLGIELFRIVRQCMDELGVASRRVEGYRYYYGIKKR